MNGFSRNELLDLIWSKPTLAQLELTRNCNQKCCFCFQHCTDSCNYIDLDVNSWFLIIDKLENLGIETINLSGGEVFLYKNIKEILKYAKLKGFKTVVNTNGTIDISSCIVHGLKEIHSSIVNNSCSFDNICKNIYIANENDVPVEINMTLINSNFNMIEDVYNYFNDKFAIALFSPTIAIKCQTGNKIRKDEELLLSRELFEKYFLLLKKIPKKQLDLKEGLHSIFINDYDFYSNACECDSTFCIGGKTKLIVSYNGDVYSCNFFQTPEFFCGNILYGDEKYIWENGKGFLPFRKMVKENLIPEDCKHCGKYYKCFSGCRAWTKLYTSTKNLLEVFENAKDFRCDVMDAFIGNRDNFSVQSVM